MIPYGYPIYYYGHQYPQPMMMYPYSFNPFMYDPYYEEDVEFSSPSSDPPPILTDPPAQLNITLFKELSGYPNYGNPSGNADILYTGNRGVWTFEIPPTLSSANYRARLSIRAVLDDHTDVAVRKYSLRISINGTVVHNGPVPLEHGSPAGKKFNNWGQLNFNVPNLRRRNRVVIENTSSTGPNDWIAFDWMEMRLIPSR